MYLSLHSLVQVSVSGSWLGGDSGSIDLLDSPKDIVIKSRKDGLNVTVCGFDGLAG